MNGNAPVMNVAMKLMVKGVNASSNPYAIETSMDINMNKALTSNALPTFIDIVFRFITYNHCCKCKTNEFILSLQEEMELCMYG